MASKILRVIIEGDVKGALAGFAEVDAASAGTEGKLASIGKIGAVAGVAAGAGVAAIGIGLFKVGESFDEAYDKIRVGTGATGEALDGLKDEFRQVVGDVPTDFGKAADAITAVTSRLGLEAGPIATKVSEQMLELSRITGTDLTGNLESASQALLNFNVPITDYSSKLDEMFRASQASGISFSDLSSQVADAGVGLRAAGFDFDQSLALVTRLGQAGVDTSALLPALGKSLAVAAKDGKSASDVFRDTVDAIKAAPDPIAASGIALDVFGAKAGPKLAALIGEGKLSYEDLMSSIQNGGDSILGAGKDTQDFGEKWELIKNRVLLVLEPIATKVFNGVGKAMDKLGPVLQKLGVWFNTNLPIAIAAVKPWFDRLVDVLGVLGRFIFEKVVPALVAIGAWIIEHKPILEGLAIVIGGVLVAAFVTWAAGALAAAAGTVLAAAPVIALGLALAALVAGIIWVVENFDIFKNAGLAAFDFVKDKVSAVIDWIGGNWPLLLAILTGPFGLAVWFIVDHWEGIMSFFGGIPGRISDLASGMWNGLSDSFRTVVNAIIGVWNALDLGIHIGFDIPSWVPGVGGRGFHFDVDDIIPDIPYLAAGGIVTSPTVALLGESGAEAIIPLDRAGSFGGDTLNVSIVVYAQDGTDAGQKIAAALEDYTRRGGSLGPNTRRAAS